MKSLNSKRALITGCALGVGFALLLAVAYFVNSYSIEIAKKENRNHMKYLVEIFTPKQTWRDLSKEARVAYLAKVNMASKPLIDQGVEVIAVMENDSDTIQRLDYQFFGIWKFPTDKLEKSFEALLLSEGWFNYFDHVNLKGQPAANLTEKIIDI